MKLSVPQYAKTQGISKVAAYKRVKTGKVQVDANGLVDVDQAAVDWEKNRDVRQGSKNPSGMRPAASTHSEDRSSLSEAQRAREWLRVKREKLTLETAERKLIEREEVRQAVSAMITASKSRLSTMADELCDRLAAESDSIRCREMVARKVNEALSMLSEWPA